MFVSEQGLSAFDTVPIAEARPYGSFSEHCITA
jgi:hypothetical protein